MASKCIKTCQTRNLDDKHIFELRIRYKGEKLKRKRGFAKGPFIKDVINKGGRGVFELCTFVDKEEEDIKKLVEVKFGGRDARSVRHFKGVCKKCTFDDKRGRRGIKILKK